MINSIEDLKDRYGYRKADCCANCENAITGLYSFNCYLNKKTDPDTLSIPVSREGYCSSFNRRK